MAVEPNTVKLVESVARLAELLLRTDHGGFPVIIATEHYNDIFFGLITRYVPDNRTKKYIKHISQ